MVIGVSTGGPWLRGVPVAAESRSAAGPHSTYNDGVSAFDDNIDIDSQSSQSPMDDAPTAPADSNPLGTAAASPWRYVVPVALIVLVFAAFMPALAAGWVGWDDDSLVLAQTQYRGFSADSLRWMFTTSFSGHFQPLTWLSYALDYKLYEWGLWELNEVGFHLMNVAIHALTAVAFYFVARRLLAIATGTVALLRSASLTLAAAFAAALFAVHPLRAESVAWIAERRDVLSGLFFILAVGAYLRYAAPTASPIADDAQGSARSNRWPAYIGTIIAAGLSMLAKAPAMTLPLVLLVLDVYPLGRWERDRRRMIVDKIPLLIMAVLGGMRAIQAQRTAGAMSSLSEHDLTARIAQACYGLTFYVHKTLLPLNLGPMYQMPPRDVLLGPMFWLSGTAVVIGLVVCLAYRRRIPQIVSALAVYAIILGPVLGFVQSGRQIVADRYSYLSCLGFAVLAGGAVLVVLRRCKRAGNRNASALTGLGVTVIVVALAHANWNQTEHWDNPLTLWWRAIQVSPNSSVAHVNYANALGRTGIPGAGVSAIQHYRRGLQLDPEDHIAYHYLGRWLAEFGETDSAIDAYRQALVRRPDRRGAPLEFARLLVMRGQPADARHALTALRDCLKRHPDDLAAVRYLAELLARHPDDNLRDGAEAVRLAENLMRFGDATNVSLWLILADAYAEHGEFDRAIEAAKEARRRAESADNERAVETCNDRLGLFADRQPYRMGGNNVNESNESDESDKSSESDESDEK